MKNYATYRASLALLLSICLSLPGTVLGGGKSGKKNFKEGVKYESTEQWDLAAEAYALAVASEPDNAEYRLRLLRAMQMAALMFTARGDLLEAQNDYAGAYSAYARSYTYDRTNETARIKMARMIEQQRAQAGLGEAARYNPRNGNIVPAGNEIRTPQRPPRGDVIQKIEFNEGANLKLVIQNLARQINLNVIFDESFKDNTKFALSLTDVTVAKALDLVLLQNKLLFEQADRRSIVIYLDNQNNRQRMERLLVKTFYLSNAELNETRAIVQATLGAQVQATLGAQRQVQMSKQLNALVVRATASELALVQKIIESLDKNRSEVVIDVDIYEVSDSTSLELGNQLATSGLATTKTTYDTDGKPVTVTTGTSSSIGNLGGLGRGSVSAIAGNIFGIGGGLGTIIGLPPSSLSLLQTQGKSKLLASTQVHSLDGENNLTVVGRSVPIRLGSIYPGGYGSYPTGTQQSGGGTGGFAGGFAGGAIENIQYRDVGLLIDVTPTITNEGYVQVKMKLESSNVEAFGSDPTLTPAISKRSLTTISRVQDGVTSVVACVKQDSRGDSRATIPVVGLVPILGRLFTTPKQTSSRSDIVITVTPRIIRPAEIKPEDHLAHFSGAQSIEDVMFRAHAEDEMERRAIAQRSSSLPGSSIINASAGSQGVAASQSSKDTVTITVSAQPEAEAASADEASPPPSRAVPRAEVVPARRPEGFDERSKQKAAPEKGEGPSPTPPKEKSGRP